MRHVQDPGVASKQLVNHALSRFSTDNLSCMIVRFDKAASAAQLNSTKDNAVHAEARTSVGVSEAEKLVMETKKKIADGTAPAVGVSASNSGRGHDAVSTESGERVVTTLGGPVEEEPLSFSETDSPEAAATDDKDLGDKIEPAADLAEQSQGVLKAKSDS